jgi:hypothetical protein
VTEKRGKVTPDDARRWARGELPSAEFFERIYREERERAEQEVDRLISRRQVVRRRLRSRMRFVVSCP